MGAFAWAGRVVADRAGGRNVGEHSRGTFGDARTLYSFLAFASLHCPDHTPAFNLRQGVKKNRMVKL